MPKQYIEGKKTLQGGLMGRYFIILVVLTSFLFQACEAFNEHYDEPPEDIVREFSVSEDGGDGKGAEVAVKQEAAPAVVDYTVDETVCNHIDAIEVMAALEEETEATAEASEGVSALKLAKHTIRYEIEDGEGTLQFTIKQVEAESYNVCDVVYTGCVGECMAVPSVWSDVEAGTVEVKTFPNEGSYKVDFIESNMGDEGLTLEGEYSVEPETN